MTAYEGELKQFGSGSPQPRADSPWIGELQPGALPPEFTWVPVAPQPGSRPLPGAPAPAPAPPEAPANSVKFSVHSIWKIDAAELKVVANAGENGGNTPPIIAQEQSQATARALDFSKYMPQLQQSLASGDIGSFSAMIKQEFGVDAKAALGFNERNQPDVKIDFDQAPGQAEITIPLPSVYSMGVPSANAFGLGLHKAMMLPSKFGLQFKADMTAYPDATGKIDLTQFNIFQQQLQQGSQMFGSWLNGYMSWLNGRPPSQALIDQEAKSVFGNEFTASFGANAEHLPNIILSVKRGTAEAELSVTPQPNEGGDNAGNPPSPDPGQPPKNPPGGDGGGESTGSPKSSGGGGGVNQTLNEVWDFAKGHPVLTLGAIAAGILLLRKPSLILKVFTRAEGPAEEGVANVVKDKAAGEAGAEAEKAAEDVAQTPGIDLRHIKKTPEVKEIDAGEGKIEDPPGDGHDAGGPDNPGDHRPKK